MSIRRRLGVALFLTVCFSPIPLMFLHGPIAWLAMLTWIALAIAANALLAD